MGSAGMACGNLANVADVACGNCSIAVVLRRTRHLMVKVADCTPLCTYEARFGVEFE